MMPTNRTRTTRNRRRTTLTPDELGWLNGQDDSFFGYGLLNPREFWDTHKQTVLAEHIKQKPGSRPFRWWQFDAPEPRQRLGGVGGVPIWERLAVKPYYEMGVPASWIMPADLQIHKLSVQDAVDLRDPPVFESEAVYIRRLGLLAKEEQHLDEELFQPVRVTDILPALFV